jgi:hypothetical protein
LLRLLVLLLLLLPPSLSRSSFSLSLSLSLSLLSLWCPSVIDLIEGDFPCPRVLAAWEIGANEVFSLLVWIRPLLSR